MKSGKRRRTPERDLRLSRIFSVDPGFRMRLQLHREMRRACMEPGERIVGEVKPAA